MKVLSFSDTVMLDIKVFQMHGAATKNTRSPIIVKKPEDGVTRADIEFVSYPIPQKPSATELQTYSP